MDHFDAGHEHHAPAARANRGAEVHVFEVHEIALVEQPRGLGVAAPHQKARPADPVRKLLAASSPHRLPRRVLLPEFVERTAPCGRTTTPRARRRPPGEAPRLRRQGKIEHVEQAIDGPGRHDRVAVEQQEIRAGAGTDADVVSARESQVGARVDDPDAGPPPRGIGAAVGRSVVDDDHFVAARGRRVVQRLQAAFEIGAGVERDDDDRRDPRPIMIPADCFDRGKRLARSHRPAVSGQHIGRSRQQPRARRLVEQQQFECSRDRLVSHARTYNAAAPQLSRATAVSSRTGGTPAASASSGVRPRPSYSDRNAKARARAVQLAQLCVRHVAVPADPVAGLFGGYRAADVFMRKAAIVAGDVEGCVRMRPRDRAQTRARDPRHGAG